MLEVALKPTFPDDMSRDEMLTQFMYLINQYSTDLRHSDDWPCHFCGKQALETTMCISLGINNPRPYAVVWMYQICTTEEGPCMLAMDEEAKANAKASKLPYAQPARRTKPLYDGAAPCPNCVRCRQPPSSSLRMNVCSGCKITRYCGRTCQKTDWTRHKKFCKMVSKAQRSNPTTNEGPPHLFSNPLNWI